MIQCVQVVVDSCLDLEIYLLGQASSSPGKLSRLSISVWKSLHMFMQSIARNKSYPDLLVKLSSRMDKILMDGGTV